MRSAPRDYKAAVSVSRPSSPKLIPIVTKGYVRQVAIDNQRFDDGEFDEDMQHEYRRLSYNFLEARSFFAMESARRAIMQLGATDVITTMDILSDHMDFDGAMRVFRALSFGAPCASVQEALDKVTNIVDRHFYQKIIQDHVQAIHAHIRRGLAREHLRKSGVFRAPMIKKQEKVEDVLRGFEQSLDEVATNPLYEAQAGLPWGLNNKNDGTQLADPLGVISVAKAKLKELIKFFQRLGMAGDVILACLYAWILWQARKKPILLLLASVFVGWCNLCDMSEIDAVFNEQAGDIMQGLFEAAQPHLFKEDCVPQSGLTTTIVAAAVTMFLGRKVPTYSKLINAPKLTTAIDGLLGGSVDALESLVNFVLRCFNKQAVMRFRKSATVITDYANLVEDFDRKVRLKGAELDEKAFEIFGYLCGTGEQLLSEWPRASAEWGLVSRSLGKLSKLSSDYPANFTKSKGRVEPVGIMLSGGPGVGKTYLTAGIARTLWAHERPGEPYDMSKAIFQKPSGDYWEGYKGQLAISLDDVFARKPVPGEANSDAEEVIRLINQWPLSLNMANCALKGRFFVTSPFVLATSNIQDLEPMRKAMTDADAILRRFPHWYHVENVLGKVDPSVHPDDNFLFYPRVDSKTSRELSYGRPIKYTQVMDRIIRDRVRKLAIFDNMKSSSSVFDEIGKDWAGTAVVRGVVENAFGEVISQHDKREYVAPAQASQIEAQGQAFSGAGKLAATTCAVTAFAVSTVPRMVGKKLVQGMADGVHQIKVKVVTPANILKAVGFVIGFVVGYKMTSAFLSSFKTKPKAQKLKVDYGVVAQAGYIDEVLSLFQRNMFKITLTDGTVMGTAIALDDMTLAMPAHFLGSAHASQQFLVAESRKGVVTTITAKPVVIDHATDQAVFRIKTYCKNIRAHVANSPVDRELYIVKWDSIQKCAGLETPKPVQYPDFKGSPNRARIIYSHNALTKAGDCGSLVVAASARMGARLYGMHTGFDKAAKDFFGCYTVLSRARECEAQSKFCGHEVVEELAQPIHNGGGSKLEPTPYAGLFSEVRTMPAAKTTINGVDPMKEAISGYGRVWSDTPPEIAQCISAVMSELHRDIEGLDVSPCTLKEAAFGIPDEEYCKGLARGKSPGYPMNIKYQDKRPFLGDLGPYTEGPAWGELVHSCESMMKSYREGERVAVFRDTIKDEPRPIAKVLAGQSRLISCCPITLAVVGRMQTLRYTSAIMRTRHSHGMFPGLNVYGWEASMLFSRLAFTNKKGLVVPGDYKKFDKSQAPSILYEIWEQMISYLVSKGGDRKILEGLRDDSVYARHLGGDCWKSWVIYEMDGTLPSGHWMTAILNSIYNKVVLRYAWVKHKGMASLYDYKSHVSDAVYGDDFVMAPDDENLDFNFSVLKEHAARIDLQVTNEEGTDEICETKPLEDTGFLCRKFRLDEEGRVWMCLDRSSIDDMFNWKKSSTPLWEHTQSVSRAALIEAAAHPFDVFEVYHSKIKELVAPDSPITVPALYASVESAYDYWRIVHREYVPIYAMED